MTLDSGLRTANLIAPRHYGNAIGPCKVAVSLQLYGCCAVFPVKGIPLLHRLVGDNTNKVYEHQPQIRLALRPFHRFRWVG